MLYNLKPSQKLQFIWCPTANFEHYSFCGAGDAVSGFPLKFEDSLIASKIQLQKVKIGYTIVHGLAPYFQQQLKELITDFKHIVVGFNERLNKILQKQQMDFVVRYCNS